MIFLGLVRTLLVNVSGDRIFTNECSSVILPWFVRAALFISTSISIAARHGFDSAPGHQTLLRPLSGPFAIDQAGYPSP